MTPLTHSLDDAATIIGCQPRWLADGIRGGRFPARKIARQWRMTDSDIAETIEICKTPRRSGPAADPTGNIGMFSSITPRSRRKIMKLAEGSTRP